MLLAAFDNWERWVALAVVVLVAYLAVVWAAAVYWTYRDSASRSRDPVVQGMATLLVVIFNLPGLLLYLILRPKLTLAERYDRRLEAEALLHEIREQPSCPACRRHIESDFISCPYCKTALRVACDGCSRALSFGWVVCPYCGVDRQRAAPAQAPEAPAAAVVTPVEQHPAPIAPATVPRPRRANTARYTPSAKPAPSPASEPAPDATP